MKKIIFITFILTAFTKNSNIYKKNYNYKNYFLNGVYKITSMLNNHNLKIKNNCLKLLNEYSYFRIIILKSNEYFIELIMNNKRLGVDKKDHIKLYNPIEKENIEYMIWNIIKINENQFLIQNKYNQKLIEAKNYKVICKNKYDIRVLTNINKNCIFSFLKLYEEEKINKKNLEKIQKEPIDIVIKYIDLTDKSLNRFGIKQTYKDKDNEELKYSIRSIITYIPWIRKIHILMPNNKVRFFKSFEKIKYKINYINDKDFLGFESANIFAFTFNLHKLEKFGVTKNFIYMEDDFFIGKSLKKTDFFYYDEKEKRVIPFLLTKYFDELNKTELINNYNALYAIKDSIFPHSRFGWWLSIYCTNKYFIERYKLPLINTKFTHNAISENIDDLKEIFKEIRNYEFINETLFSKERFILTLNQPQYVNLYQLNIKHKKVNSIKYNYIEIELINKKPLNSALFVINTSGNHIPLNRHYKIQKKIMEKRFQFQTLFEIKHNKINEYKRYFFNFNIIYIYFLKIFIIIIFLKII